MESIAHKRPIIFPKRSRHAERSSCLRCGTCCAKGGPAFHTQDKELIRSGTIELKNLYTLREGEPVHDNVKGILMPAACDIIKTKRGQNAPACIFFDPEPAGCRIYENRPLECRLLRCWDTRALEARYASDRLTRRDLLSEIGDLWSLVADHQRRCDYRAIWRFLDASPGPPIRRLPPEIHEMIRYDACLRQLMIQKGGMDAALMDFLLGRPLGETLRRFGFGPDTGEIAATPLPSGETAVTGSARLGFGALSARKKSTRS